MSELPDDRLDELFRKSAEELYPAYDPADWEELSARLDARAKPAATGQLRKWGPWGALLLLLLGGGLGTYYGGRTTDKKAGVATTAPATDQAVASKEAEPSAAALPKINNPALQQNSGIERTYEQKNKAAASSGNQAAVVNRNREQTAQKILPRRQPDASGVRLKSTLSGRGEGDGAPHWNNSEKIAKGSTHTNSPSVPGGTGTVATHYAEEERSEGSRAASPETTPDLAAKQFESGVVMDVELLSPRLNFQTGHRFTLPEVSLPDSGRVAAQQPAETTPPAPKWAIRLGVSPDMSTVGLQRFTRPGPSASLLVEYAVSPRLYLQSGVIRSLKTYQALPGQYQWPSYWTQYIRPISVDGDCKVLEIPLNLRYDVAQRSRSTWFVGTGVSSYRMQKEVYKYNYERPDPSIKRWRWEGQTGWYWLSHLNASVGYEYRLSGRLSLLAEPYVRLPLRKVGYGKVNLFTTGVWVSVRYVPAFRNKSNSHFGHSFQR